MSVNHCRKFVAVLIIGLFFMQLVPVKPAQGAFDQSAYYEEVGAKLEAMANKYNIPPVVLKAVAWMESGWKQYMLDDAKEPLTDQPLIGSDGIGIGIMQISSYDPADEEMVDKLKYDIDYNIEEGCKMLNQKWRAYPKIGDGDRNVLENWYFAVWGYNSWAPRNNPNYPTGKNAYQDSVFSLMGQKYNSSVTFAPGATKIPAALLPAEDPPSLQSCWVTPTPTHLGDLAVDPNSLISTGGGSGTDAANGDYWFNYARWGSYYALGFYVTAYNSPELTDKSLVRQKILKAYENLLAEADDLVLEDKDTLYATAAKYYWAVLQGPALDSGLKDRAEVGYQKALAAVPAVPSTPSTPSTPATPSTPTTPELSVTRLAGLRAEDTAIKISQEGWADNSAPVVLLARSDRFQDALAAAPLARKLKAPLLLTGPYQLESAVLQEIKRLGASDKVYVIGGTGAIKETVTDALSQANLAVERVYGATAADTAAEIARKMGPNSKVILASSVSFPDALSASAPAAALGIPILLSEQKVLSVATKQILADFQVTETIVVGGNAVIATSLDGKGGPLEGYGPLRLAGETKYDTMLQIVTYFKQDPQTLVIATGENFPDGLTGGAFAALTGSPMLLIPRTGLDAGTKAYLTGLKGRTAQGYVLGGTGVISAENETLLKDLLSP